MPVRFPYSNRYRPNTPVTRRMERRAFVAQAKVRSQIMKLQTKMKLMTQFKAVEQDIRNKLSLAKTIAEVLQTSRQFMEGLGIGGVAIYRYSNESQNMWAMEREALRGVTRYETPTPLLQGEKRYFIETAHKRNYPENPTDILLVDRLRDFVKMSPEDRRQAEEDFESDLRRYFGQDYAQVYAGRIETLQVALRFNLYVRYPGVGAYDMIILANNHVENAARIKKHIPPVLLFPDARRQPFVYEALRSLQRPITEELHKAEDVRLNRKRIAKDAAIDALQLALNATDNLSEMFEIALDSLPGVYMRNGGSYVERSSIMLFEESVGALSVIEHRGLKEVIAKMVSKAGAGIAGHVFEVNVPLLVMDAETDEVFNTLPQKRNAKRGSFMCVPIGFKGKRYGVLNVRSSYVKAFTDADLRHLQRIAGILAYKMHEVNLVRQLERAANYDGLTGLPRREYAISRIEDMLQRAEEARMQLAFIMLDLDCFKRVNDRYGHKAGDTVLRGTAGIISAWLGKHQAEFEDSVGGRWGGEEWVIGALGLNEERASALVEDLRRGFEARPYTGPDFWGENLTVTVSIGVAIFPFHGRNIDALSINADRALYGAKHEGRNRVNLYDPSKVYSRPNGD
ncbi:MAG: sensor domain-containing diguanylate cyclase [Candidatus Margulisbacteria bacterium]|nr:sensor domain-containing diguanylate cyclase [Candidatus Margulisiibacteriota bacterium]